MRSRPYRRLGGAIGATVGIIAVTMATAGASGAAPKQTAAAAVAGSSAFTKTETITRASMVNGANHVVDARTVKVSVSQTANLKNRQEVSVSWSGAHPTGGLIANQSLAAAAEQEYPMVMMECRGGSSPSAPVAQQISPETCWTQTAVERMDSDSFLFPSWRLDEYATAAGRALDVGLPTPLPQGCRSDLSTAEYWVPFEAADGTLYGGGPADITGAPCAGMPPEALNNSGIPGNTTYGATTTDGTGSDDFVVQTAETNASLGCSQTVACSLVIIPIMGLSCDPQATGLPASDQAATFGLQAQATSECESLGSYTAGESAPPNGNESPNDLAVTGSLWFAASNWRNRIVVPLSFAPPSNECSVLSTSSPLDVYGSELMDEAFQEWGPSFCTNPKLFNFNLIQTAEPEAKALLANGSIEAAVQGAPPPSPFATPTVQAPVALSGFAITYDYGNSQGSSCPQIKLDARLLAKLLTESYQGEADIGEPGLEGNQIDIAADPEFKALNPGCQPGNLFNTDPSSVLYTVGVGSDTTWALTSYINADPEARAWLNGAPDPWGMKVNPAYEGIRLPVSSWPLLDTFDGVDPSFLGPASPIYSPADPCLSQNPTEPIMPLIAAPQASMQDVTLDMQYDIAASTINCTGTSGAFTESAMGRQDPGNVLMFGVTSLADAEEFGLQTAALQTSVGPDVTGSPISDASGRTFVTPTNASVSAAAALLQPSGPAGTWLFPYSDYAAASDSVAQAAYPGTMVLSLDVPTTGLPAKDAQDLSELLSYAAGAGQIAGTGLGQLPSGYLPMSAADGLSGLVQYTEAAAADVAAQSGKVPPVLAVNAPLPPTPPLQTTPTTSPSGPSTNAFGQSAGSSGGSSAATAEDETRAGQPSVGSGVKGTSGTGQRTTYVVPAAALGRTSAILSGVGGLALPIAVALALSGGAASGLIVLKRRRTASR